MTLFIGRVMELQRVVWMSGTLLGLYLLHLHSSVMALQGPHMREYCQWESFNASCGSRKVVAMETAKYGRMTVGRCLKRDYGYVGCEKDVRDYVDYRCSGRHSCAVSIPDPVLDNKKPCPDDLKAYLQASYTCLPVETGSGQICRASAPVRVRGRQGYLASVVTEETGLGSETCPWLIEGLPGQRVSISLLDFASWSPNRDSSSALNRPETSGICHIYATIKEGGTVTTTSTICGGQRRQMTIYESETESVQVEVANMKLAQAQAYFLLQYEVTGCGDVPVTSALVLERDGSRTRVKCRSTGEEWTLECQGDRWVGTPLNCTDPEAWGLTDFIENAISLPQGVLIIIIIGIAILIALGILALGMWSLRRRHKDRTHSKGAVLVPGIEEAQYSTRAGELADSLGKEQYPMLSNPDRGQLERESDYTSTWHRRAAVPATIPLETPPPGYGDGILFGDSFPSYHMTPRQEIVDAFPNIPCRQERQEHIYESPRFGRREPPGEDLGVGSAAPFYHELDPDRLPAGGSRPGTQHRKGSRGNLLEVAYIRADGTRCGTGLGSVTTAGESRILPPPPPPPQPKVDMDER